MSDFIIKTAEELCEEILEAAQHFNQFNDPESNSKRIRIKSNARVLLGLVKDKGLYKKSSILRLL